MSWFWRGFQSAIFYYVSCAPCTKFAYQRRRRKDRKRANAELQEVEEGSYRHPSPFNTNVYWREEMLLGPGPPQKKKERDKERLREREQGTRRLQTGGSTMTGVSSADTVVETEGAETEPQKNSSGGWNRRRYQREDEILWGFEDAPESRTRTPEGGLSRAATGSSAGDGSYYSRNPEVNDLHPPIVATPRNKSETRWMLQPPPSAKVMEGRERAKRSRSGSGTSYGSAGSSKRTGDNLGRRVGEKLLEERLRRGDVNSTESVPLSKASTNEKSSNEPQGQRHDRDRRMSEESPSTVKQAASQRRYPPPPISITADLRPPASRPPLETINSQTKVKQERPSRPKLVPMDSASSLRVLQELISPLNLNASSKLARGKLKALPRSTSPLPEAAIKLPPVDKLEDRELGRWSMDI